MRTQQLIALLAADIQPARPLGTGMAWTLGLALIVAIACFFVALGPRPDLPVALETIRFVAKPIIALALAVTALAAVMRLARPGGQAKPRLLALLLAPALVVIAVILELASLPAAAWRSAWLGYNVPVCLVSITALAVIPLAALLFALRRGAATRPALTGAVAGLAAAGIAAALYAFYCPSDSPLFVATWYTLAVALITSAGAALGARVLRW